MTRIKMNRLLQAVLLGFSLVASMYAGAAETQPNAHPTIRAMLGATTPKQLDPKSTALLVIDFQNEYFSGRMPIPDGARALANAQRLVKFADKAKLPVYQVQHVAPAGSPLFASDGDTVKFHPGMQPRAQDKVLRKSTVSVFASTDLDSQLKKAGIKTLIISGLMTHACVAAAARDAVPLGYQVLVASDATATRSITRENGVGVDKDSLHNAALAEIEDTFGSVLTTDQILALPLH